MKSTDWSTWPAPAKLNLFLHVTGRRDDGYHLLQTVFRLLDWGDTISIRLRSDGDIVRHSGAAGVPAEQDLAVRAARALAARADTVVGGADISIDKQIPVGAGLGGGSSDAATVLVALNRLWELDLELAELAAMGQSLGADVPVFVHGHSAWAEGTGEQLTPLELDPAWYLLLDPHCAVSTAELFAAPELTRDMAPATISAFRDGELKENCFEPLVRQRYPPIAAALDWLSDFASAHMSGTGSVVFAEFASQAAARGAARQCPSRFTARVVRGVNSSPLLKQVQSDHWGVAKR
ncbi:MAG: 4-(cytidine 5'-diphospho)-2-C-methyl-D-erythritol kinase [Rhodanobacteraceae bacterium]